MNETVAAVFATMGRPQTAVACAKALAAQTRPPSWLVVACNDPEDGTMEALRALEPLPFRLVLHAMATNRGNAGGIEEAAAIVLASSCATCWILDDDSWPEPDSLEKLVAAMVFPDDVAHPLQLDPVRGDMAWPVALLADGGKTLFHSLSELPEGEVHPSSPAWTGALVPIALMERAGPIPGDLFIRGEDEEYPERLRAAGARFLFVPGAVLKHPGPKDLREWRIAGKSVFWEPRLAEWKLYYKIRNLIWRKRKQGWSSGIAATLMCTLCIIRYERGRLSSLKVLFLATRDAWANRLGQLRAPWAP